MFLSKTEQALLNRDRLDNKIYLNGKREVLAAKKLVQKGLASQLENLSYLAPGEYYICPFTRRQGISKTIFVYGGNLYFKA